MQRVLSGANNLLEASVVFVSKFEFYLGLKFSLVLHFILWFHIQLRDTLSLCSEIWLFFGAFGWKPILIPFLILTPWHWQPGFIPCLWAQPFESPYRADKKANLPPELDDDSMPCWISALQITRDIFDLLHFSLGNGWIDQNFMSTYTSDHLTSHDFSNFVFFLMYHRIRPYPQKFNESFQRLNS